MLIYIYGTVLKYHYPLWWGRGVSKRYLMDITCGMGSKICQNMISILKYSPLLTLPFVPIGSDTEACHLASFNVEIHFHYVVFFQTSNQICFLLNKFLSGGWTKLIWNKVEHLSFDNILLGFGLLTLTHPLINFRQPWSSAYALLDNVTGVSVEPRQLFVISS